MGNWSDGFMGPRGTQLHETIVNWTRFDLVPYLRMVFPSMEWDCIYDESLSGFLLGYPGNGIGGKDGYFPDGLWFYNNNRLIIEVGNYNLVRLPNNEQMIHIGFDGQINVVNPKDEFVLEVADAIKDYQIELLGSI